MTDRAKAKTTMTFEDRNDRKQVREINHVIDIRDFLGTPGYSMLFVAANTNLSSSDIWRWLAYCIPNFPMAQRSLSWCKRRRWMFQQPGTTNPSGRSNRDGKGDLAQRVMRENPNLSVRKLAHVLKKDYGIDRSSEWVRQHRCD
jgi:hypothetical protein